MLGLSGLGLKLAIAGIIVVVITSAIGGFWLYQKSIISDLNDQIADKQLTIDTQKAQIAGLVLDKEKLELSNSSLENEIARKSEETKDVFEEIQRLRTKDLESANRLQKVEGILRDSNRQKRLDAIRDSKRASLLLRLMNKNVKCYAEHFNEVTGRCIRGKWVPDGTRLVPLAPVEPVKPDASKEVVQ